MVAWAKNTQLQVGITPVLLAYPPKRIWISTQHPTSGKQLLACQWHISRHGIDPFWPVPSIVSHEHRQSPTVLHLLYTVSSRIEAPNNGQFCPFTADDGRVVLPLGAI